jgi:Ca2+-binding RTX toxin-like protein
VIAGLGAKDLIEGRAGNDLICGGSGVPKSRFDSQQLTGGAGNDKLRGGPQRDVISGSGGDDVLKGGRGNDDIRGGKGDDISRAGKGRDFTSEAALSSRSIGGNDIVHGGQGQDTLWEYWGHNLMFGGPGSDHVIGGRGNDVMHGGGGSDRIAPQTGDDAIAGGKGRDVADYVSLTDSSGVLRSHHKNITVNLRRGTEAGMGRDRLSQIEGVYSGGGQDTLIGNSLDNRFYIGITDGKANHDHVAGHGGSDTLIFSSSFLEGFCCSSVNIDLGAGSGTWGGVSFRFTSIENVRGSGGSDMLLGSWKRNRLVTSSPLAFETDDIIRGRRGPDRIVGGRGDDRLYGGPGTDHLFGQGGADLLDGRSGQNSNDGGPGVDQCLNPNALQGAVQCES